MSAFASVLSWFPAEGWAGIDVYKRQTTIFMLIGALLSAVAGSFVLLTYQSYSDEVKSAAAVSYTHLDVYKRQG